jgi:hypothetical protein
MPRFDRHQVTVLLGNADEERFSAYCTQRGFKKSTLIVRLIREHLNREGFALQPPLFDEAQDRGVSASRHSRNPKVSTNQIAKRGHG